MLRSVIIPFAAPTTVGYAPTALMAWRDFKQTDRVYFGHVSIVAENKSNTYTITVNVGRSARGAPDEVYPLTIPPGEQRSYTIEDAAGVLVQLDAHTQSPGQTADVCFEVSAYDRDS